MYFDCRSIGETKAFSGGEGEGGGGGNIFIIITTIIAKVSAMKGVTNGFGNGILFRVSRSSVLAVCLFVLVVLLSEEGGLRGSQSVRGNCEKEIINNNHIRDGI